MNGSPPPGPQPAGVNPDYARLLRALDARRVAADNRLLHTMIDLPDPHPRTGRPRPA